MLSLPHGRAASRTLSRIGIPNGIATLLALVIALPAAAHVRTAPAPIDTVRELASAEAIDDAAVHATPIKLYDGPTEFHVFARSGKLASGVRAALAENNINDISELRPETRQVVDYIFRWYRAGWGRYTSSDPIGLAGGLNLFRYAAANPLTNTDPTGLVCDVKWWSDEIGGFWGKSPIDHRFVTWPTGSLGFQPNGGSAEVTFVHGGIKPIPGHVSHDTPNPEYDTPHETYWPDSRPKNCPNCKAVWQCLDNFAKQFESTKKQWCVIGDNCQTAVNDALSACGLSRTPPTPPSPRFPHNKPGDPF